MNNNEFTINWGTGVTKLENLQHANIPQLDQKGFFLLLGGIAYASNLTYERVESIYLDKSFDHPLRTTLSNFPDSSSCIRRFLKAHYKMDLLFLCGIVEKFSAEELEAHTLNSIKDILVREIQPACNDLNSGTQDNLTLNHKGVYNALLK